MKKEEELVETYVKKHNLHLPTKREIARSVPPGKQSSARKQNIGDRIWIGKCSVYGCKMWYSEEEIIKWLNGDFTGQRS